MSSIAVASRGNVQTGKFAALFRPATTAVGFIPANLVDLPL